jgi:hypothetical protein
VGELMDQEKISETLAVVKEQEIFELKQDVKNLNAFKWKTIGVAITAGVVFSALIEIARAMN